jgi:hypothetical protein
MGVVFEFCEGYFDPQIVKTFNRFVATRREEEVWDGK